MKLTYKFLNSPNFREIYYLHLIRRLKEGFFQKNGFVVLPKAMLKTSAEVVVPLPEIVKSIDIDAFLSGKESDYEYPFIISESEYKKVRPFGKLVFPKNLDCRKLEEFLKKNYKKLNELLLFLLPDFVNYKVCLNIIPVDFGTGGTFYFQKKKDQLDFIFTYRTDLSLYYPLHAFISCAVLVNINSEECAETDSLFWQKRQYLTDYLANNTGAAKLIKSPKVDHGTLTNIKKLKQLGRLINDSKNYLKELGFDYASKLTLTENNLFINETPIYLTESERKVIGVLIEKSGEVCTFDEIANILWGEDSEKFSYYAISRILSDIRAKIKNAGVINEILYTARGKGVLLSIYPS